MMTYLVLDAEGYAVAEEYTERSEAEAHANRIGGWVTEVEE